MDCAKRQSFASVEACLWTIFRSLQQLGFFSPLQLYHLRSLERIWDSTELPKASLTVLWKYLGGFHLRVISASYEAFVCLPSLSFSWVKCTIVTFARALPFFRKVAWSFTMKQCAQLQTFISVSMSLVAFSRKSWSPWIVHWVDDKGVWEVDDSCYLISW